MSADHTGPIVPVSITVDGKTFVENLQVSMEGLAAAIVDRALAFTCANDRGDAAGDAYDDAETDEERAVAASQSEAADHAYNSEKAQLFELCRLMSAARAQAATDCAIAKATGSAS